MRMQDLQAAAKLPVWDDEMSTLTYQFPLKVDRQNILCPPSWLLTKSRVSTCYDTSLLS